MILDTYELEYLLRIHLVQLSIVAALCLLTVRLLVHRHPHLCHAILLVAMIKCLFPPLVIGPIGWTWRQIAVTTPQTPSPSPPTADQPSHDPMGIQRTGSQRNDSISESTLSFPATSHSPAANRHQVTATKSGTNGSRSWPGPLVSILMISPLGCVILVAMTIRGWGIRRRLFRALDPEATQVLHPVFERVCRTLHVRRARLWVTHTEIGPAVFGVLRPTVTVPSSLVHSSSAEELEILLSHELNHVRRSDTWAAYLQTIAVCFWWFNPLVWLLSRNLSLVREYCCDLETIARQNLGSKEYCTCLLNSISRNSQRSHQIGLGVSPYLKTKQRLEMIMTNKHKRASTPLRVWIVAGLLAFSLLPGALAKVVDPVRSSQQHDPDVSSINYVSDAGIISMDSEGEGAQLVFPQHQNMQHPVVSPDGRSLAHVSWVNNERRVWVSRGGERPKPISPNHDRDLIPQISWSPDGQLIAYRTNELDRSAVYLMKPDGSQHRKLKTFDGELRRGFAYYDDFCWSPDSKSLAVARVVETNINKMAGQITVTTNSVLEIFDISSGKRTQKTKIADRHLISSLSWSPDGKWIAYKSGKSGTKLTLYPAEGDEEEPRILVDHVNPSGFPKWNPDSKSILVHTNRLQNPLPPGAPTPPGKISNFLIVDLDGNTKSVSVDYEIWYYDWLSDGEHFVASSGDRKLRKLAKDGSSSKVLAEDVGFFGGVQAASRKRPTGAEKR